MEDPVPLQAKTWERASKVVMLSAFGLAWGGILYTAATAILGLIR